MMLTYCRHYLYHLFIRHFRRHFAAIRQLSPFTNITLITLAIDEPIFAAERHWLIESARLRCRRRDVSLPRAIAATPPQRR